MLKMFEYMKDLSILWLFLMFPTALNKPSYSYLTLFPIQEPFFIA